MEYVLNKTRMIIITNSRNGGGQTFNPTTSSELALPILIYQ